MFVVNYSIDAWEWFAIIIISSKINPHLDFESLSWTRVYLRRIFTTPSYRKEKDLVYQRLKKVGGAV